MNKFDFIGYLRDYCNKNNIYFIAGPRDYENAVADWHIYEDYELVMLADLSLSPDFETGDVTYTGNISLGRKREDETMSSLDETFQQKYDRRLLTLTEALYNFFSELQCSNGFEILRCEMSYNINILDINIDAIMAYVTIKTN